jgi:ubiquinol-cytochrome c reductase cytochrome b subunit
MGMTVELAAERAQTYFPSQLVRDLTAAVVVLGGVVLWVWREGGVPLGAPADPAIEYVARPEWYFLPIFHLRHWYTGSQEFIATTVLPGTAIAFLCALPFLYARLSDRRKHAGGILVGLSLAGMVGTLALGATTAWEDAHDAHALQVNARADAWAKQAQQLAMIGVPIAGPLALYENDPLLWGERVFGRQCAACHGPSDLKPYDADLCLDGYGSRTWIKRFMRDPHGLHFFGNTKIDLMDAFDGDDEKLTALDEYLYSLAGRPDVNSHLADVGAVLYEKEGCTECHLLDGIGTGDAPDLKGWVSPAWLSAFIREPGHSRFYGSINEMDAFDADHLSPAELRVVIAWLRSQSDEKVKF